MMKRSFLALAFLASFSCPTVAQQARIVQACGATAPFGALTAGGVVILAVDTTGTLCSAGGGGGGGGTVTQGPAGASPWLFDTTGTGHLDTEVKAPIGMPVNITETNCSVTLTTGGTAQNAFPATATIHGFRIANIDTGHGDEVAWWSTTGTAAAGAAGSYPLTAPTATTYAGFGAYTTPAGEGVNTALSVVAATTGHVISCTYW